MERFELILKNEKVKQYRVLALLIILVNVVFFAWTAITNAELRMPAIFTIVIILAAFVVQYFTKKYSGTGGAVLFIAVFYIQAGYWQVAIIIALLAILYIISVRQLIVLVSSSHILYPSFPKKEIEWSELNNMVLKDGLLTIDFKNNKIAQATIINGENDHDIDEKEFNEFCQRQLNVKAG